MPTYEFVGDDGTVIEAVLSIRSPQADGAPLVRDGKTYRRIMSSPPIRKEFPTYVSYALPKHWPGCKCDPKGRPVIESRAQERRIAQESGLVWL